MIIIFLNSGNVKNASPESFCSRKCTKNREPILLKINKIADVGAGLVPAHDGKNNIHKIELTHIGKIIENEIYNLEKNNPIKIESYVIMPNHIHFIVNLCKLHWNRDEKYDIYLRAGTRPAPTIPNIVRDLKSKTTLEYIKYNKQIGEYKKLWQRNYYEHIIRNENEYYRICEYIKNNPNIWEDDIC